MESINFRHHHPLTLVERVESDFLKCIACLKRISGQTYVCNICSIFLHKSCAELPREIQNPFHPHPLTLLAVDPFQPQPFHCKVCLKGRRGFIYRCNHCEFDLDVKCAFLTPTIEEGQEQLKHSSHLHPLALIEKKNDDGDNCRSCSKFCSGPTYGCILCKFFLHQSCAERQFPQEIQHFSHPCSLFLCTKPDRIWCRSCNNVLSGFFFHCEQCKFQLDVECALLPTIKSEGENQIHDLSHGHPLILCMKKEEDGVYCSACGKCCSGPTYVCERCNFYLQESCIGLPQEIQHPFHPSHPLSLGATPTKQASICNACCNYYDGCSYYCNQCDFNLHVKCAELMPTVEYEGHSHLLTLITNVGDIRVECNTCKIGCESALLRCVECNFNLHLQCGPLPLTIKDKCHIHHLTLTDSPVKEDTDMFCCDVCEKERDPRLSIYYCADCGVIAETTCVISEVMRSLKGENGDVELRSLGKRIAGKVISKILVGKGTGQNGAEDKVTSNDTRLEQVQIQPALTFDDVIKSFSEDENMELNGVLEARQKEMIRAGNMSSDEDDEDVVAESTSSDEDDEEDEDIVGENMSSDEDDEDIVSILKDHMSSDKAYTSFMEELDSCTECSMPFWGIEEVVIVGDYMVPRLLAPVLADLIAKYGDISAESPLSPRVKMFYFVMLCGTIDSMCNTRVVDIKKNLLFNWWNCLKTLQLAGFKIQFALDHLKRVANAYFGLQAKELADNTLDNLSDDITDLEAELKAKTEKLEALKVKRELITRMESEKSGLMEECWREASELKWRKAGAGLL